MSKQKMKDEDRIKGKKYYLFIDGAVVIGSGQIIVLRVKQTLLVVQQLSKNSADTLLVPQALFFGRQTG